MPELPEVETIKNDLRALVLGRTIKKVEVLDPPVVKNGVPKGFEQGLVGQQIVDVGRRAKYLLIKLSSGRYLVVQLMLTGQLLVVEPREPLKPSTRLILYLDDGRQMRLVDSRRFARVRLVEPAELNTKLHLDQLGPEPLNERFTAEDLAERLRGRGATIKSLLLDQRVVAGLGNIYADEVLFKARIHPAEPAKNLSNDQIRRLYEAIRETLREAISHRGTTTRSYRDALGRKGQHQQYLLVHTRFGKPCQGCPGRVEKTTIAGRQTFFCPSCQVLSGAGGRVSGVGR